MASVTRGLMPLAGDAWRDDDTAAGTVVEASSAANAFVVEASVRGSDGDGAARERQRASEW